jgi:hypothetical protein
MSGVEQQMLLKIENNLYSSLERETLNCLKNLESMPAQEIEYFVEKRQEILSAIQKVDTAFNHLSDRLALSGDESSLRKFRLRPAAVLSRVIEADGLLLALAEMKLTTIKAKLAGISRGRGALHGYREEVGTSRSSLKRVA